MKYPNGLDAFPVIKIASIWLHIRLVLFRLNERLPYGKVVKFWMNASKRARKRKRERGRAN